MPQTTEITKIKSIEDGLQQLTAALTMGTRDDGSTYRFISNMHPMYGEFIEIVRELHSGEMPNDWRFEAIYDICHALLEHSEPDSKVWTAEDYKELDWQIAEDLVDLSYHSLFKWLSEHVSRRLWVDEDTVQEAGSSIGELAQMRQQEELNWMIVELIDHLDNLVEK